MNNLIQQLSEFHRVTIGSNLEELSEYYSSINKDFGELSNAILENKETWKYGSDLKGKLFRIYFANESIIKIAKGHRAPLKEYQSEILDVFSIFTLSRQQIETFLTCYHLYFEEVSDEERKFRNLTYKLNGLGRQLDLVNHIDDSDERKKNIAKEYNETIQNLRDSTIYKKADKGQQEKYEKPKHALTSKKEHLMRKTGLGRVEQNWRLYSNYAHSEYISDRQYNTFFRDKEGLVDSICTTLNSNCRLTAKLIALLSKKFPYIRELHEKLSEYQKLKIKLWNKASEQLK